MLVGLEVTTGSITMCGGSVTVVVRVVIVVLGENGGTVVWVWVVMVVVLSLGFLVDLGFLVAGRGLSSLVVGVVLGLLVVIICFGLLIVGRGLDLWVMGSVRLAVVDCFGELLLGRASTTCARVPKTRVMLKRLGNRIRIGR